MEIHRLHDMLTAAGIDHEWVDRSRDSTFVRGRQINWGYQICVYYPNGERMISAIEGAGTYGYGGFDHGMFETDEKDGDLIEIMGLLTPEEEKHDCVLGWLTAENVFQRIKEAVDGLKESQL